MINLLAEKRLKFDKKSRVAAKARMWSGVVLVVYVAIMVLTLVVGQVISIKINKAKKALEQAKSEIASQVVLVNQYETVIERADVIKEMLGKRRESIDLWNKVQGMLPSGVELSKFGLKENVLSLSFKVPHVVAANQMMDVIEQQFESFEAESNEVSISRSSDASYSVSTELVLR